MFFKALDFFSFDIPQGGFQVAYDYTFLCAIPPELREPWGRRYAELITPGGERSSDREGLPEAIMMITLSISTNGQVSSLPWSSRLRVTGLRDHRTACPRNSTSLS